MKTKASTAGRMERLRACDFLARECSRFDPQVQTQVLGSQCFLLVRLATTGEMYGVIVVHSGHRVSYRFRTNMVVASDDCDRVVRIFIVENRRLPFNCWFVDGVSGEVRLAGELRLRGDPGKDAAIMRRRLFRPVSRTDRRIGNLFVARTGTKAQEQER